MRMRMRMGMRMGITEGGGRSSYAHTHGGAASPPPRVPRPKATQSNSCTWWTGQRLSQSNTPSIYTDRYTYKDADKDTDTDADTGVELLTFGSTTLRLRFIQTDTKMETDTATDTDESMIP